MQILCPKYQILALPKYILEQNSLISMLGSRGTIRDIAPEVFNGNFGGISYMSDVYSYRMMILEIEGGRKKCNVRANNTSIIYFPHWIYKQLEVEELGSKTLTNEENKSLDISKILKRYIILSTRQDSMRMFLTYAMLYIVYI